MTYLFIADDCLDAGLAVGVYAGRYDGKAEGIQADGTFLVRS